MSLRYTLLGLTKPAHLLQPGGQQTTDTPTRKESDVEDTGHEARRQQLLNQQTYLLQQTRVLKVNLFLALEEVSGEVKDVLFGEYMSMAAACQREEGK